MIIIYGFSVCVCGYVILADVDSVIRDFAQLDIEEVKASQIKEDYYVHIDFMEGSSQTAASRINSFMIRNDSYDPRRGYNFPTDLMEPGDKDTLKNRRKLAGDIGKDIYELWKVRKTFSLADFGEMVAKLPRNKDGILPKVRIVRIIGYDHRIDYYESKEA